MKIKILWLFALIVIPLSMHSAQAGIINNTGTDVGTYISFGAPDTSTYGQTLLNLGPDTQLDSFSMFLRNRGDIAGTTTLDLRGYVAGWDGSKATSILYESSTQTMNDAGALQEFAFAPGINLMAGNDYVFFLSILDLPSQSDSTFGMPVSGNTLNGEFVYQINSVNFGSLFTNSWDRFNDQVDVWFKADFRAPSGEVPEPASFAIFGTICLLACGRRRVS